MKSRKELFNSPRITYRSFLPRELCSYDDKKFIVTIDLTEMNLTAVSKASVAEFVVGAETSSKAKIQLARYLGCPLSMFFFVNKPRVRNTDVNTPYYETYFYEDNCTMIRCNS